MRVFICKRAYVYPCVLQIRTCLYYPDPITEDSNSCCCGTDIPGDSKTDIQDDLEIHTGSYCVDQRQFGPRPASCECLLLYYFLIYHYQ